MADQRIKIIGLVGATMDPKTKDRTLAFNYSDGSRRQITIDEGAVGAVLVGLLALKHPLPETPAIAAQAVGLTAVAGPLNHPEGQILLLELGGSVHLPVRLTEKSLDGLRTALERFGPQKTKSSSPPRPH